MPPVAATRDASVTLHVNRSILIDIRSFMIKSALAVHQVATLHRESLAALRRERLAAPVARGSYGTSQEALP